MYEIGRTRDALTADLLAERMDTGVRFFPIRMA